jgi:hypothetical protein
VRGQRQRAGQVRQLPGVGAPVVGVVDQCPLEGEATALGPQVVGAGAHQDAEREAPVDRHQLVTQAIVGRVQRHGQVHRQVLGRQPADAGHEPDGRQREVAGRQPEPGVRALHGWPHPVVVGEGLAHAHEHDVAQPPAVVAGPAGGAHGLLDDLTGGEVALETRLPRGAEAARHGAPGLGRHAHGRAVAVVHEHGLDVGAPVETEQPLHRRASTVDRLAHGRQGRR